jgi:hypothetical protein
VPPQVSRMPNAGRQTLSKAESPISEIFFSDAGGLASQGKGKSMEPASRPAPAEVPAAKADPTAGWTSMETASTAKLSMHSLLCSYCRNYMRQLRFVRNWSGT